MGMEVIFIDLINMEIEIRSKSTLMVINLYGVKNVDAAELITVWNRCQPLPTVVAITP